MECPQDVCFDDQEQTAEGDSSYALQHQHLKGALIHTLPEDSVSNMPLLSCPNPQALSI